MLNSSVTELKLLLRMCLLFGNKIKSAVSENEKAGKNKRYAIA